MKTVAIVPMKLNNTRLPQKNIKPFTNGKPLCSYILNTLLKIEEIDEVYVYCSNENIKQFLPDGVKYLKRSETLDTDQTKMNEVLKAFAMVVGMQCREGRLEIKPRLPWLWDTMECRDWPVVDALGRMHRIDFVIRHDRWLRSCTVELHGIGGFEGTDLRIGPFPRQLKNPRNFEMELIGNASWIWVRDIRGNEYSATVEL